MLFMASDHFNNSLGRYSSRRHDLFSTQQIFTPIREFNPGGLGQPSTPQERVFNTVLNIGAGALATRNEPALHKKLEEIKRDHHNTVAGTVARALLEYFRGYAGHNEKLHTFAFWRPITPAQTFSPLIANGSLTLAPGVQQRISDYCLKTYDAERMRRDGWGSYLSNLQQALPGLFVQCILGDWDEVGGVLILDVQQSELYIVMRGTLTQQHEDASTHPEWKTNCQSVKQHPSRHGLNLPGDCYHGGFLERYKSFQVPLYGQLHKCLKEVKNLDNLHITVAGHSLGGALAHFVAADLACNVLPKIYHDFSNSVSNRIHCVTLASPRVAGTQKTKDALHAVLGRENFFRLVVQGDVVPHMPPDPETASTIKRSDLCPEAMYPVVDAMMGYYHVGYAGQIKATTAIATNVAGIAGEGLLAIAKIIGSKDWQQAGWTNLIKAVAAPLHNGSGMGYDPTYHPRATLYGTWQNLPLVAE